MKRQTFESILYFYMSMMNSVNDMTHMTEQDSLVVSLSLPTLAVSSRHGRYPISQVPVRDQDLSPL